MRCVNQMLVCFLKRLCQWKVLKWFFDSMEFTHRFNSSYLPLHTWDTYPPLHKFPKLSAYNEGPPELLAHLYIYKWCKWTCQGQGSTGCRTINVFPCCLKGGHGLVHNQSSTLLAKFGHSGDGIHSGDIIHHDTPNYSLAQSFEPDRWILTNVDPDNQEGRWNQIVPLIAQKRTEERQPVGVPTMVGRSVVCGHRTQNCSTQRASSHSNPLQYQDVPGGTAFCPSRPTSLNWSSLRLRELVKERLLICSPLQVVHICLHWECRRHAWTSQSRWFSPNWFLQTFLLYITGKRPRRGSTVPPPGSLLSLLHEGWDCSWLAHPSGEVLHQSGALQSAFRRSLASPPFLHVLREFEAEDPNAADLEVRRSIEYHWVMYQTLHSPDSVVSFQTSPTMSTWKVTLATRLSFCNRARGLRHPSGSLVWPKNTHFKTLVSWSEVRPNGRHSDSEP